MNEDIFTAIMLALSIALAALMAPAGDAMRRWVVEKIIEIALVLAMIAVIYWWTR